MLLKIKNLFLTAPSLLCAATGLLIAIQTGSAAAVTPEPSSLETGFRQMYNLDFSAAHKTFEAWQELHPADPLGAASNAAAYLFAEFERLHILDLDVFTEKKKLEDSLVPDPVLKAEFEKELTKADDLAGRILAESADDRNALFARTLTLGLRGNYAALVENKKRAGLDFLKSSRVAAEKLLAVDPDYHDAYLAIGIENYLLGIRAAPARWMLRLSGGQTNKDKGIASIKITAAKGRYLGPYARLLLAIAALRDKDRDTAKTLLADLAREFPQNRLYQLELAQLES